MWLCVLWQACIDENAEMVQFLVESGSDVNRGDNEGWTPLHAAASCGFIQIAKWVLAITTLTRHCHYNLKYSKSVDLLYIFSSDIDAAHNIIIDKSDVR